MSSFKDIRNNDIKNVLINVNEFATEHTINNDSVLIVLDSNINKERVFGNNASSRVEDGIYLNHLAFFVSESVLGYRPAENDYMTFNGETGIVASCQDEAGLLYIVLEMNLS